MSELNELNIAKQLLSHLLAISWNRHQRLIYASRAHFDIPRPTPPDPTAIQPRQLCLQQAPVAKKAAKRIPKPQESSEVVEPQSVADKLKLALEDLLKESGTARTAAIQLAGLEYADHLHRAIKEHADKVEGLYAEVQTALKRGEKDRVLSDFVSKVEVKSEATKKFQARPAELPTHR